MSFSVYILGPRAAQVSRRDIAEFIEEGCYFDAPAFDPEPDSAAAAELDWTTFDIFEQPDSRPITIRSETAARVAVSVDIVVGTFDERGVELPPAISARLAQARHVYVVEMDRGAGISDESWGMLSSVEAFLARRCGGIVFTNEDGVYDADLRLLVSLSNGFG